ncbi:MAG: serine hydrolase [Saprospiraceae bacterium]|nr:serine hydrolase [Saprospiraceae bacterium]
MKYFFLFLFATTPGFSQSLYFPPTIGSQWETISAESLGWCTDPIDELYQYLENENTKAFLVLKDGKIVLEKYFDSFTQDSLWYWASAGKTMTSFLIGLAQQEGKLKISDSSSKYLGKGWTSCTESDESDITIWHQLTMTSGLDDRNVDADCTSPECLVCFRDPGERWSYHNAPYTLLDGVIENASGQTINQFMRERLLASTGIAGIYLKLGYNNVLFSKPRVMARFGLLMLNGGNWNNTPVLRDSDYHYDMIHSSQDINKSYGYLWWLNGQESYMVPGLQLAINGSISPNAPDDMYSAMGKNGQILNIVPSQNLIVVRMGDAPNTGLVPFTMADSIWRRLSQIICLSSQAKNESLDQISLHVSPNPARDRIAIKSIDAEQLEIFNSHGQLIFQSDMKNSELELPSSGWSKGLYFVRAKRANGQLLTQKLILE